MVRGRNAVLLFHAEDAHRQPSHRARDPIAIRVQRRLVRRADILEYVHFHSVDDGMEILTTQPEIAHRRDEAARARDRPARVKRIDVGAPALELLAPFATGRARVRDVVDLAAKGIDLEHRLALRTRQYAPRAIALATRPPLGRRPV